jgi:HK97 gp10 family phage protein
MKMRAEMVGDKELAGQLGRIDHALRGQMLLAAVKSGAELILNRWKELIRDRAFRTGTYRRSTHIETITSTKDKAEVAIGTDITDPPYPVYLEMGTSTMEARPTARPAWDEKIEAAKREIMDALKDLIEKAAR